MKTAIILGSVKKVRLGDRVSNWVSKAAKAKDLDFEVLDLKDYPLPFFEEVDSPDKLKGVYQNQAGQDWAKKVGEFDSFIFIAPEYNHGYSAVLKNALDYLYQEIREKPIGIISYSNGLIAGARMVEQLRNVIATLGGIVIPEVVHIGRTQDALSDDGTVLSGPIDASLERQLNSLISWTEILNGKRSK